MFEEKRALDRQIRAARGDATVRVYQICSSPAAEVALEKQTPELAGTTWLDASFRCAAYRRGNGNEPGHERVLAVDVTRAGFEWALAHAAPDGPVRVVWEPERDLHHTPLNFQAIRIGLSGEALGHYAAEWSTAITDVTPVLREIAGLLAIGRLDRAVQLMPHEPSYELPPELAKAIDATG